MFLNPLPVSPTPIIIIIIIVHQHPHYNQTIIKTNVLTKLHEDWTINVTLKNCLAPGGHIFQWTRPFSNSTELLLRQIVLTSQTAPHTGWPYWTKNKTSRVLTRKTAPPPDIIGKNVLTKFHKDWIINVLRTINVASRVLTRQNVDDGVITKAHHEHVVLR
ncbi:hypothetical protein DPMN_129219 [Dreissena polymorpha]|uniref:Uncharacterized protein n=1 Tax=Dreissena polymorpha TaxID=45954 RepID=A0A9D4H292_DREPO|nr:hypothetical protein DPMN_129219 [Dreissena polymorpha]